MLTPHNALDAYDALSAYVGTCDTSSDRPSRTPRREAHASCRVAAPEGTLWFTRDAIAGLPTVSVTLRARDGKWYNLLAAARYPEFQRISLCDFRMEYPRVPMRTLRDINTCIPRLLEAFTPYRGGLSRDGKLMRFTQPDGSEVVTPTKAVDAHSGELGNLNILVAPSDDLSLTHHIAFFDNRDYQ